jgi:hypothetical protein
MVERLFHSILAPKTDGVKCERISGMVHCRMILRHADGRVEETSVHGDGPIAVGSLLRLPPHADHWWKVVALRWPGDGGSGYAELEPTTLPPGLAERQPY